MDLQASGHGRREERVPLDAWIELRSEESDEVLEADGLDLSLGGLAVRASFIPPLHARLRCQFRCPPGGDPVRAEGEVVWAESVGPRSGAFGMRFLELDTKGATAIRRLVKPAEAATPEPDTQAGIATLRIDGLGAPIETDVRLAGPDRIVLEQELSFLKLGRGVEIELPGRGKERGRIASVDLRQGPLEAPTLVFGVLLDGVHDVPELADAAVAHAPIGEPAAAAEPADTDWAPGLHDTWPERPMFVDSTAGTVDEPGARDDGARPEKHKQVSQTPWDAAGLRAGLSLFRQGLLFWRQGTSALQILLRRRLGPAMASSRLALVAWLISAAARVTTLAAQVRALVHLQLPRLGALGAFAQGAGRHSATPVRRVQRSGQGAPREVKRIRGDRQVSANRRVLGAVLGAAGIALGIYALAPRSGADRIRVRPRPLSSPQEHATPDVSPAAAVPVAPPGIGATATLSGPTSTAPTTAGSVFGAAEVPNGRVFTIRMSGPVETVEGDQREDGFTARVPGRLALDRASPIATSHRAVARAMILNRGDFAELTVDFLPGLRPKYQVKAADNAVEVTLERL